MEIDYDKYSEFIEGLSKEFGLTITQVLNITLRVVGFFLRNKEV